jgi:outer membrane protein assembly factor BamB
MSEKPVTPESMRRAYVREGTFVAHPLSFPDVSVRVDPDASHITALAPTPSGAILGTSGTAAHVCQASLKPPAGYVYDYGALPGATETAGVGRVRREEMAPFGWAAASGQRGGAVHRFTLTGYGGDGIQEWGFRPPEVETVWRCDGEALLDAKQQAGTTRLFCLTESRLVCIDLESGEEVASARLASSPILPRLGERSTGEIVYGDGTGALYQIPAGETAPAPMAVGLPYGEDAWGWCSLADGTLVVASPAGELHGLGPKGEWTVFGVAPLAPVQTVAALPDGRLYGVCGDGVGEVFRMDATDGSVASLGVATAVLGVKRYGYRFGCSAVGADGEIYFGEADRGGHLFIYFPPGAEFTSPPPRR